MNHTALFASLPASLTTLRISLPSVHGIGLDQFAHPIEIPAEVLNGLKTFEFNSDWGILHAPRLLLSCANFEYLSLNFRSRDPRFAPFEEGRLFEVHLPNLRTLRLQNQYYRLEMLKFFRTPALETLDIGYEKILFRYCVANQGLGNATLSPKGPLCEFVLRSGCQEALRSLRIHGFMVPLDPEDVQAISADCPSLTHLSLDRVGLKSDEFFYSFQRKLAGCGTPECIPPSCLPHLQQLQILDCPKKDYCCPSAFVFLRRLHHARGGSEADRIELVMSFGEGTGWEELAEEDFSEMREWAALDAEGRKMRDPVVFKIVGVEYGNKNWADPDDDGMRSHPFARPLDLAGIQFETFTPVNDI
ncbi:hypothetical protein FA13DRAFT_250394 [Coprinellus micaceus]|uniref:F-box domain-containing protein n=1 Tax=Coprinellus micaceus TaxID=71717 RepID=A0A4Y7TEL5_COPMI|nr:hypothetical protein FA13DRAFT_250394 [Coprinellus micaceus]